jgi:toxin ParE1/3/4
MRVLKKLRSVEVDIAEAAQWYERQRPGLGQEFIAVVQSLDAVLLANPLRFSISYDDIRRLSLGRFPYSVFYFIEVFFITAETHGRF